METETKLQMDAATRRRLVAYCTLVGRTADDVVAALHPGQTVRAFLATPEIDACLFDAAVRDTQFRYRVALDKLAQ